MASQRVQEYWDEFLSKTGVQATPASAFSFGDSPEMANDLLELILRGPKRATAGLARPDVEPLPKVGDYSIVLDGQGRPACIIVTTDVEVKPLSAVDAQFAWDEGEGDRSLSYWMDAHIKFFTRQAAREGFEMHPNIETVCERFRVVWPQPDPTP